LTREQKSGQLPNDGIGNHGDNTAARRTERTEKRRPASKAPPDFDSRAAPAGQNDVLVCRGCCGRLLVWTLMFQTSGFRLFDASDARVCKRVIGVSTHDKRPITLYFTLAGATSHG